jgi:hypothetical protein
MLGTILIVVLVLMLIGAIPTWSHSREWGYFPEDCSAWGSSSSSSSPSPDGFDHARH